MNNNLSMLTKGMEETHLNITELGIKNVEKDFSTMLNLSFFGNINECEDLLLNLANFNMNNVTLTEAFVPPNLGNVNMNNVTLTGSLLQPAFLQESIAMGENVSALSSAINESMNADIQCLADETYNPILQYISYVFSIICFVMILVGNGLILLLTCSKSSLKSPVFSILRSFSVISIVSLLGFTIEKFLKCEMTNFIFKFLEYDSRYCYIDRLYKLFNKICENLVLYHLLLLTLFRMAITAFPLRALVIGRRLVHLAILSACAFCLIIEIILELFFPSDICKTIKLLNLFNLKGLLTKQNSLGNPQSFYQMILITLVFLLLVVSMVISVVQARLSSAMLQTTHQRRQSKVASIVITLFTVFFLPLAAIRSYLHFICASDKLGYVVMNWLPENLKYAFYALNPIILFLRQPSIWNKILQKCQKTNSKGNTNSNGNTN